MRNHRPIIQNRKHISRVMDGHQISGHVSRKLCEMYCGHAHLCLSVCGRMPTPIARTRMQLEGVVGEAPSCALLGGFAIGARVALLWQRNVNRSYKLAFVSDIAVFVLKSDVKLQQTSLPPPRDMTT